LNAFFSFKVSILVTNRKVFQRSKNDKKTSAIYECLSSFYEGLELQPAVSSKKLAIFKPNQQLQAGDDQSIEEISTNDLPDEDTLELKRKFSKFLKMLAKNYYQQTNSNNFPTEKTDSISVLTNLNQKLPGNQI